MKKVWSVALMLVLVFALGTVSIYAAGSVKTTLAGAVAATGEHEAEKEGDAIKLGKQADFYGFKFENVTPGVYKIGYYMNLTGVTEGKQMRISPKVTGANAGELRCWIDYKVVDYKEDLDGKVILVIVITVPEGYDTIDAGYYNEEDAYQGTLEKVVLATGDYSFQDAGYTLIDEKSYGDAAFGEDPDKKLLPEDGAWTPSKEGGSDTNNGNHNTDGSNNGSNNGNHNGNNNGTIPPKTGDPGLIAAILLAGAALAGGIKLKKK